mgnify:CR=1 FL=1
MPVKCWYCHKMRELGDNHMYSCVQKIIRTKKVKEVIEGAYKCLEAPCPVEQCGVTFKGDLSTILLDGVKHFELYHSEELY